MKTAFLLGSLVIGGFGTAAVCTPQYPNYLPPVYGNAWTPCGWTVYNQTGNSAFMYATPWNGQQQNYTTRYGTGFGWSAPVQVQPYRQFHGNGGF